MDPEEPKEPPTLDELEEMALVAVKAALWLDLGAVLEARRSVKERFSTGLPSVDLKIEGGLYAGTLTIVQGKPGIGKTMLATQIALALADRCAVAALYADEGMQGAAVRIGQQLGVSRAKLIDGEGITAAKEAIARAPFFRFLDPSHADSTVEFLFDEFDQMAPKGIQRVYLVDSAQVVRSLKVGTRMDRRQAISTLLVQLRELALKYRAIVIVVSQVGRGSYRSKNEDERIDPLAAGLESSAIEFMADLILHLDGKPTKEDPAVKLRCPKNRMSAEGSFEVDLAMDFARSRFVEPDMAALEAMRAISRTEDLRAIVHDVLKMLKDYPDGASGREIEREVEHRAFDVRSALKLAVADGVLVKVRRQGRGAGMLYKVKA